jgi:hypothetical protein
MNRYHLEIIHAEQISKRQVDAEGFEITTGVYVFFKLNKRGERIYEACYPIDRTIVQKIEWNVVK